MPTYVFHNTETKEEWTEIMSISSCEKFLSENPLIELRHYSTPLIVRGVNAKPDNAFRDVLKEIKRKHRGSNINTF
jgi:hypothetical protein